MVKTLIDLKSGQSGRVVEIQGGVGASGRIQNIGIRVGKKIKKVNTHFRKGPQTVLVDNFKVAIGFGMASKIIVEVDKDDGHK